MFVEQALKPSGEYGASTSRVHDTVLVRLNIRAEVAGTAGWAVLGLGGLGVGLVSRCRMESTEGDTFSIYSCSTG